MTDQTRKVQLAAEVDATGAKKGFEDIKQGAREMAQTVQQAGQQAGQGMKGVGDGAAPAAQKLDAATRSMIGSIQRTTAAMEAGGKATAKYYESIAQQRGISPDVLRPYIEQLREAEAAAAKAGHGMDGLSFATAGAKRELLVLTHELATGNFKRFGTSLLVLGEQTGAAGALMSGAAVGVGAFVAAIAAGIYAIEKGSSELKAFQTAATLTGNAVGLSASGFGQLRDALAGIGATKGAAAEVLTEIASSGKLAGNAVQGIAEAALLMQRATGQATADTIKQFEELAKSPVEASAKLNDSYHFLTAAVFAQIKALQDQGKEQEAANLAESTYAAALKTRAQDVLGSAGTMQKAWHTVTDAAKSAWDAMLGIGRQLTPTEQLAKAAADVAAIQARIAANGTFATTPGGAAVGGVRTGNSDAMQKQLDAAKQVEAEARRRVELEAGNTAQLTEQNRLQSIGIDWMKQGDEFLTKQQQKQKELTKARTEGQQLVNAGIITEQQLRDRLAGISQKYAEQGGLDQLAAIKAAAATAQQTIDMLRKKMADGDTSGITQLTEAQKKVNEIQAKLETTTNGVTRAHLQQALAVAQNTVQIQKEEQAVTQQYEAWKKSLETITKQTEANDKLAESYRQQAVEQEAVAANFGKSDIAIKQALLSQTKMQIAEAEATDTFDPKYLASLYNKKAGLEALVPALQDVANKQVALNNTKLAQANDRDAQLLQLELSLVGQTQEVRQRIVEQRRIELEYAQKIADVDKQNLKPDDAAARKAELETQKAVALSNAAAKSTLDEWQRTADSINQSLTDALLNGFNSGKTFAQNLRDSLKTMFANLVLRPVIQAALSPVSGVLAGIGQSFGQSAVGSAGGITSGLGSLTGIGTSLFGGGVLSGAGGAFGGGLSATLSNGLISGFGANAGNIGTLAAGGEFLGAAGAALPYVGIGLAAASALGLFDHGGPKTESGFGPGVTQRGDPATSQAVVQGIQAQYQAIAGSLAKNLQVGVFTAQDPQGTALTQLEVAAQLDGSSVYNRAARLGGQDKIENVGRSPAELQAAITEESDRVILGALQATHLPDKIGDYLKQLGDVDQLSGGALDAAVQKVTKAMTERQTLEQQLFDLSHTDLEKLAATREKERAAIDDTNQALYDQVAQLQDLATAAQNTQAALDTARTSLSDAYQRESSALQSVVQQHSNYAAQLRQVRDSLAAGTASGLSRAQVTARAGQTFQSTLTGALGGNDAALQALGGAGSSFVDAIKQSARSPAEIAAVIARVQAGLTTAATSEDTRATVAQQQLDAMTQQLTALGVINTTVQTVGDALAGYLDALNKNAAAQAALQAAQLAGKGDTSASPAAATPAPVPVGSLLGTVDALKPFVPAMVNLPGFASGGQPSGAAMVGERGPEVVDFDTPGRVYTNEQTRGMFASNTQLLPALQDVKASIEALRTDMRIGDAAKVTALQKVDGRLKKFDIVGMPPLRTP